MKKTAILICLLLGALVSASHAGQRPVVPTSVEAAELAAQRERAARELNKDDEILRQGIRIKANSAEVLANEPMLTEEKPAAARQGQQQAIDQIVHDSKERAAASLDELLRNDPMVRRQLAAAEKQDPDDGMPDLHYRLFVSQSMTAGGMRAALDQAEKNQDMVLVFRGLKRGQKFSDIMKLVTDMHVMKAGDNIPRIIIDPTLFTDSNISVVPTLEYYDDAGKTVASVRGVANPRWLEEQVASGRKGDLGALGTTSEIAEVDMITLLKEAAAKIDLKAYGERMVQQFWQTRHVTHLPTATVTRTRKVDPTVVITEAITAPDGTVLAYPGQRLNPMDVAPFSMKLVIIDARDDAQVLWARRQVIASEGKPIRVIASEFDTAGGLKEFDRLVGDVGRMVYLLEPTFAQRMKIERVPSTVEGGDGVLIVREYARDDLLKGLANVGHRPASR